MAISNYFRNDGWVKNVQGAAIPGAQIYVLTQPANVVAPITPPRTTPVPFVPNPQALIYSDQGITPIVQPIITDGFGHYDFYVLPGLYTVAVFVGGKLQQFYIDQTVGNIGSSGGTAVLFETNGTPNFNQTIFNAIQGAGMTILTDNEGNTTFSVTGTSLVLKTNGVTNPVQNLQNLVNGVGIGISTDGSGNVTVTNTGVGSGTSINSQSGDYTAQLSDANNIVSMNSVSANVLTVPANASVAYPVGTTITVFQQGAGTTTLSAAGGVTILTPASLSARVQNSTLSVIKLATDTWWAAGDLA